MKKKFKKILVIVILTSYCYLSLIITPVEKARANPVVGTIPAGITIGAGTYVTGAFIVAGLAGVFGYTEYENEINAHAARVWDGATKLAKDSMTATINAAWAAGDKTVTLTKDFWDYLKDALPKALADTVANPIVNTSTYGDFKYSDYEFSITLNQNWEMRNKYVGPFTGGTTKSDYLRCYMPSSAYWSCNFRASNKHVYVSEYGNPPASLTGAISWLATFYISQNDPYLLTLNSKQAAVSDVATIESNLKSIFEWSGTTDTPVIALPNIANFPAKAISDGAALEWAPSIDTWVRPDAPSVPVPKADVVVGTPGLTLDGNPADAGTITYPDVVTGNPTDVVTGNPIGDVVNPPSTGEGGILQGLWDWLKGILQSILDAIKALAGLLGILALIEGIKALVSNIAQGLSSIIESLTTGLVGKVENIKWDKLKMSGTYFTTKFPFSLPWDVGRALSAVFGDFFTDEVPSWTLKIKDWEQKLTFPSVMVNWMPYLKTMILVMFDITLIYSVRKLLGGAQ